VVLFTVKSGHFTVKSTTQLQASGHFTVKSTAQLQASGHFTAKSTTQLQASGLQLSGTLYCEMATSL
jgi:hypothetical protein